MKITGEVWIDTHEDVQIKNTKNTQQETRVIRRERHLTLECGHTRAATYVARVKGATRCLECEPYETLAQEAARELRYVRMGLIARIDELAKDRVVGYMRNALDELRFDIKRGYRPTLEQIDHLLGMLTAPKDEAAQKDSTQA